MSKKWYFVLLSIFIVVLITGCGDKDNANSKEEETVETETEMDVESIDEEEEIETSVSEDDLSLPEGFPSDFPLPDPMTITEVSDHSDDDHYDYVIRFSFDPDIDLDALFTKYDNYAKNLDYNIVIGGEEYFADGIFQFGATDIMSVKNMFVVTLKPEGSTYGDITFKLEK